MAEWQRLCLHANLNGNWKNIAETHQETSDISLGQIKSSADSKRMLFCVGCRIGFILIPEQISGEDQDISIIGFE